MILNRFPNNALAHACSIARRADLIEVELDNDPERIARFVRVRDTSTERVYYLRVPPTFDQADEALAWTFGLERQDYQPIQEA
ncbi:MAG TPA: hypothetical protein VH593_04330 [Ktedonobacteraceae bacterium]